MSVKVSKRVEVVVKEMQPVDPALMNYINDFNKKAAKQEKDCAYQAFQEYFGEDLHGKEKEVRVEWSFHDGQENTCYLRVWRWKGEPFLVTRVWFEYVEDEKGNDTVLHCDCSIAAKSISQK